MSNQSSNEGVLSLSLLAAALVGLKVANQIEWSWLWILSPLWLPAVFIFGVVATLLAFTLAEHAVYRMLEAFKDYYWRDRS